MLPTANRNQATFTMKYFIDWIDDTGTAHQGSIAWPAADAQIVAQNMREENPTWVVIINPLEGTP